MQVHQIVYAIPVAMIWVIITYHTWKAHMRAKATGYAEGLAQRDHDHTARIDALNSDLADLHTKRQGELTSYIAALKESQSRVTALHTELQRRAAFEVTPLDAIALAEVSATLDLALRTWKAMPGTQAFQFRALRHLKQLNEFNARLDAYVHPARSAKGSAVALDGAA